MTIVMRCSKLARPMVCAGYVHLDVEEIDTTNPAAEEGTACGELLALMLTGKPIGLQASNTVYFNDEMKFYLGPIVEDINSRRASPVLCEQRIDWQTYSGIMIKGSYDISYVDNRGRLCIDDLKYGWGIVEVFENWQLLGYAIGEVIRRGQAFKEIVIRILQPRPHHENGYKREWVLTYSELLAYKEKIENRMTEIANGRKEFQTGSACKYCKGAAEACTAFNRLFYRALEISTEFSQDSITNDELSRQLDQINRANEVLKIKADSLVQLGNDRIKKGGIIPGYISEASYGHRNWKPGVTPESIKIMTNVDIFEKSIMTPSKAEQAGVPKDLIKHLSSAHFTGMKLKKKEAAVVADKTFGTSAPKLNP